MKRNIFALGLVFVLLTIASGVVFAEPKKNSINERKEQRQELRENRQQEREEKKEERKNVIDELKDKIKSKLNKVVKGDVTAVNGSNISIKKGDKTYTIQTDNSTKFIRKFWGSSSLTEIKVGNTISVFGKFVNEAETTVQARLIRNLSVSKRPGVFFGTVQSISGNTVVIKTDKKGNQTATVGAGTKIINRKEEPMALSQMKTGDKIRVKGLWDHSNNTVTEVTQIKDFTQPVQPKTTGMPSVTGTVTVMPTKAPTPTPTTQPTVIPTSTPTKTPTPTPANV